MGLIKGCCLVGIFGGVLWLLALGANLLIPLVIAFFLWHLINAFAGGMSRFYPFPRWLSVPVSVLIIIVLFWVPLELASGSLPKLMKVAPLYQKNVEQMTKKFLLLMDVSQSEVISQIREHVNVPEMASSFAGFIASFTGSFVLILLYVAFLLTDQSAFSSKLHQMFPEEKKRHQVEKLLDNIDRRVKRYLWIKTFLSILTGFFSYLIFIGLGLDFAAFWGVLIFFLNYIPNIGAMLGVILPAFLSLVQFQSWVPLLIVFFGTGCIQFFIGNMLEPRMMGKSLNLSTTLILFSLTFWTALWGVLGAFLSVPITVILVIILSEFPSTKPLAIFLSGTGEEG